ncbi:MAG TPA: glycoside hydrolase family 16 protein [Nocardioides sp.]|nr:glycoside hydrolase family 16 protein [Nocardioides sp.]
MQASSAPSAPHLRPARARLRSACGAVTVLLIASSMQLLATGAPAAAEQRRPRAVRVTVDVLPPIAQPGRDPADPVRGAALVAQFTPASPGSEVVFERAVRGGGWRVVGRGVQDAGGIETLAVRRGLHRVSTVAGGLTWSSRPVQARRWRPDFEDTFTGSRLDRTVWNDQDRDHEATLAPRTCALVDPGARSVSGGVLHLGVALDPARAGQPCDYDWKESSGRSPYLLTTQVATEHTYHVHYGIAAARIKLQRADGMHSAFWMLPQDSRFVTDDPAQGAEIDVMEFWGDTGRGAETIGSFVTWHGPGWSSLSLGAKFPAARRALGADREWWQEFHVFSVEWTPEEYVFRVDGREHYRETRAVSHVPGYLVLSMQAADYELENLGPADLDDTAEVDWVQVWGASSR